ncbi:MAG: restriction endonuclease subunit S [Proteobacteria bacterium]|nr:restriction endonuclease subunit S [Pseudomonadota bacterium]
MAIELSEKQIKDGWQIVKFGEIAKEVKSTTKDPAEDGLELYVGLEHLDPQSLRIARKGIIAEDNPSFTRRFSAGQILFGKRRCYQKKAAVADFEGICSGDIIVMDAIPKKIIPGLLPFIIQSDAFFDWAEKTSSGSLSPRTKWKSLAEFEFPLPPIERQKEILEVLEKLEENDLHISLLIDENEKAQRTIRHKYFSDKGIRKNEIVYLSSISHITMGQSPKGSDYIDSKIDGSLPLLNGPAEFGKYSPTPVQYTKTVTKLAENGDILFCVRGSTTGRMNIADQRYCIGRGLAAISGKSGKASTDYVRQILIYMRDRIFEQAKGAGSTFPNISSDNLSKWPVRFLPTDVQEKVLNVLNNLEEIQHTLEAKKSHIQKVRHSFWEVSNELQ